jgi:hypothetical protein
MNHSAMTPKEVDAPVSSIAYRQIRALYDDSTITVYQAYSNEIGKAAVQHQRLSASPAFRMERTTWIKPSWAWMMYRSGYAEKDARQTCILAIKMKHEHFIGLLEWARLSHGPGGSGSSSSRDGSESSGETKKSPVVVQWDPERSPQLGRLEYRSIQIGILPALVETWVEDWIVGIEDVTGRARELKRVLVARPDATTAELQALGVLPEEREFEVPAHVREVLQMDALET